MKNIEIKDGRVVIDMPDKNIKKITGTKLANILGAGNTGPFAGMYTSPFTVWCDLTRTYIKPFEESRSTVAGKIIEPKLIQYAKEKFNLTTLETPYDRYGDAKYHLWDYFPNNDIFGGMWDARIMDSSFVTAKRIIECKTAKEKKRENWKDGKIPEDYYVQLGLYCYLDNVNYGTFIVGFLSDSDLEDPEMFVPENNVNCIMKAVEYDRQVFERQYIEPALDWYQTYLKPDAQGKLVSPPFKESAKGDKEALDYIMEQIDRNKKASQYFLADKADKPFY